MKKLGLEFTKERFLEGISTFGLMAVGSFVGTIMGLRYGLEIVFLVSCIVAFVCFFVIGLIMLRKKKGRRET